MLQLNNISVGYEATQILNAININIAPQEIHALMGLNGSGKTTLLKSIAGLIPLSEGQIIVDGKNIVNLSYQARARYISFLESQNQVVFSMTVKELLKLSLRLHDDKNVYDASIEALDLKNYENENLLELSSGEVKRAFIAHTLCTNAKVLLLDEPLAHLDWRHQSLLVEALKAWRKKSSTTFVLAIHELEWIPKVADKLTVLGHKKIVAQGDVFDVIQSREVGEVFAFSARIDENPIDRTKRLTLGKKDP
jgi:iron complex transport system ATP-binding protein